MPRLIESGSVSRPKPMPGRFSERWESLAELLINACWIASLLRARQLLSLAPVPSPAAARGFVRLQRSWRASENAPRDHADPESRFAWGRHKKTTLGLGKFYCAFNRTWQTSLHWSRGGWAFALSRAEIWQARNVCFGSAVNNAHLVATVLRSSLTME